MGLAIRVLTLTPTLEGDVNDGSGRFVRISADQSRHWPDRGSPFEPGHVYRAHELARFSAGSYSGYGEWRDWLAKLAGYAALPAAEGDRLPGHDHARGCWKLATSGPFYELINFTDCDGILGTEACQKLAQDFAAWNDRAQTADAGDGYDFGLYCRFRTAVAVAALRRGAVEFC